MKKKICQIIIIFASVICVLIMCNKNNNSNWMKQCEVTYYYGEDVITSTMSIGFRLEKVLDNGCVYRVGLSEELPIERFPIYLYFEDNKIYRLHSDEILLTKNYDNSEDMIVYQEMELHDLLESGEQGEHHYIDINKNEIESHYYILNDCESIVGFWEVFLWNDERELLNYKSGYAAGSDLIEIKIRN